MKLMKESKRTEASMFPPERITPIFLSLIKPGLFLERERTAANGTAPLGSTFCNLKINKK